MNVFALLSVFMISSALASRQSSAGHHSALCAASPQMMVMRDIFLYILLGRLLKIGVCSTCVPTKCLRCTSSGETVADPCHSLCSNNASQCHNVSTDIVSSCRKDFQVSINSTGSDVSEGESITLTCVHNLPLPVLLEWKKEGKEIEGNSTELTLEKLFPPDSGQYICSINSSCGSFESAPHGVTVNNSSVILVVICGVSALVLVVIMGLVMKYKLKRDNEKHKRRQKQRAQAAQNAGPAPFTPRES